MTDAMGTERARKGTRVRPQLERESSLWHSFAGARRDGRLTDLHRSAADERLLEIQPVPVSESRLAHDFSRVPVSTSVTSLFLARVVARPMEKSVEGEDDASSPLEPAERDVRGRVFRDGPEGAPAAAKKKAGVDSFEVKWARNTSAGWTKARLRLDYKAKFKKDAQHDPALAEFRQNVKTIWKITDGPNKGASGDTSPMHDDNYSRADDQAGNTINDVDFVSDDNPGWSDSDMDDNSVLEYSFTAEQMIIDTSQGNKEIAKRGPHTGTMTGKHPRTFGGVPKTLSS